MEQTANTRECKRCLLAEMNSGKEKEIVYRYIEELSKKERATNEQFQERLTICKACKWLNAATCDACGCFVEVRAAVKKNKCPYKKW
ncbi:MAG: DUF6171 family protein [bacterium]|nr:DUF6171 family protein [bacterium]